MISINPEHIEKKLSTWASQRIITRGWDYYRRGNVIKLTSFDDCIIQGKVRGSISQPYEVNIQFDSCGMPVSRCTCPFNWEPLCKHAVAVLIAWMQKETGSDSFAGSKEPLVSFEHPGEKERYLQELAELEIKSRFHRYKEEGLRIASKPSGSLLGEYRVYSGNSDRKNETYAVMIRDADFLHQTCECLDFLTNELGTCKHIEFIKRHLSSKQKMKTIFRENNKSTKIHLYKTIRCSDKKDYSLSEEIRIFMPPSIQHNVHPVIKKAFDESGFFMNGRSPPIQKQYFQRVYNILNRTYKAKLEVHPVVWDALQNEASVYQWEKYIDKISPSLLKSLHALPLKLHPYQVEGILFALKKQRAFIGDEMGLGKTIQGIGTAILFKKLKKVKRVLIICPASLKFQWKKEIEKISDEPVLLIEGSAKDREAQYKNVNCFFCIINYELLYKDFEKINHLKSDLIILDEAQRIKNWDTKIAKTVKRFICPYKLVLTGTPLENRLPELQSIAEFLYPRALGASWKLMPTYTKTDVNDKVIGYENLDHLRGRLKKFLIRRSRREVLSQLPERTDNNYWTHLSPDQKTVHASLSQKILRLMQKYEKFGHLTKEDLQLFFMILSGMRIVSNAYGQYVWGSIEHEVLKAPRLTPDLRGKIISPKLEEFRKIIFDLLENPHQKIIVFSSWERMIRLAELYVRDILEEKQNSSLMFSGSTPVFKRPEIVDRFINDPKVRILFSTDAGSIGLNLQEGSNCVINLEVPWNPAVLEQRIGRVYRMGQKKSVQVINLITSESIEERIFNLVAEKRILFEGVFSDNIKEIRFDQNKTASFMDKMKNMFSTEICNQNNESEVDDASENEVDASPPFENAVNDTVSVEPSSSQEINIMPVLSQLLKNFNIPNPKGLEDIKIKISEDANSLNLSIPKSVKTLLKGFQPLLKTLLNLSEEG